MTGWRARARRAAGIAATVVFGSVAIPVGGAGADPLPPECEQPNATAVFCVFETPGAVASLTVPADATVVIGQASGGDGASVGEVLGGRPAIVAAQLDVAGQTVDIAVGGDASGETGGANGGGAGGRSAGGGGGASWISTGGTPLMVAGGGGGAGAPAGEVPGGAGGDLDTSSGQNGAGATGAGSGGGGATTTEPGAGGTGVTAGASGAAGSGGDGGAVVPGGGGGGGGLYGGGGGGGGTLAVAGGGGGGAGSSIVPAGGILALDSTGSPAYAFIGWTTLRFTSDAPPEARVGEPYSYQYTTNGSGVTFEFDDGSVPEGLTLSPEGLLSGTPTTPGVYTFSVNANTQYERVVRDDTIVVADPLGPLAYSSPGMVTFGSVDVGTTTTPQPITLISNGDEPVIVDHVALTGDADDFFIVSDGCTGSTLAPGESCSMDVAFSPLVAGERSATVQFFDNAPDSPQTTIVRGEGVASPAATVTPDALAFGDQLVGATSAPKSVTLSSTGTAPLEVGSLSISGPNAADFAMANDACSGTTIAPGGSCTVDVTFTPSSEGARSATLRLTDDSATSPHDVALTGRGTSPADVGVTLSATPNPVRAGNQLIYTVTVANSGPATATGVEITDALPSNTRFAHVEAAAPWSCTTPSTGSVGTVSCRALALAPGVTTTVRIAVTVVASNKSNVVNTVQVASQSSDPNPHNNAATMSTKVQGGKA